MRFVRSVDGGLLSREYLRDRDRHHTKCTRTPMNRRRVTWRSDGVSERAPRSTSASPWPSSTGCLDRRGSDSVSRLAYAVLAHKLPRQLGRLVRALEPAKSPVL